MDNISSQGSFSFSKQNLIWNFNVHHFIDLISQSLSLYKYSCGDLYMRMKIQKRNFILRFVVSVQFSHSVMPDSLQTHGLQQARLPCPSPTPRVYSNSCPLSWWCHPTISSSVVHFSSCLKSFPASGSFPKSKCFTSGGWGIAASASVLPMNIQDWFPLWQTGWISLQPKGLWRVFSNTTVQKHEFFITQLSL